jgi:hypothetical protein
MNVRPKFYAWLKAEVEFQRTEKYVNPGDLNRLDQLLKDIQRDNPELDTYYATPGSKPNEPLKK